jgi:hypothetical protein
MAPVVYSKGRPLKTVAMPSVTSLRAPTFEKLVRIKSDAPQSTDTGAEIMGRGENVKAETSSPVPGQKCAARFTPVPGIIVSGGVFDLSQIERFAPLHAGAAAATMAYTPFVARPSLPICACLG